MNAGAKQLKTIKDEGDELIARKLFCGTVLKGWSIVPEYCGRLTDSCKKVKSAS